MIGEYQFHFTTPDGKQFDFDRHDKKSKANARNRAETHDTKARAAASRRAGREITEQEWNLQQIKPASDSRSYSEEVQDSSWKPKLREQPSQLERMLANAQADVDSKRDPYKGMSPEEARVYDVQRMIDDEAKEKLAAETKAAHLKVVAPKLAVVNNLIETERWSTNSDEAFRVLLNKTKQTLEEPNADSVESQRLFQAVDEVLTERQTNRQADLQTQREHLEAELARNDEQLELLSDPVAEAVPNPHADAEPKRYDIDRSKPLGDQLLDMQLAVFGTPISDLVYAAQDAFKEGNSQPAEALLDGYAQDSADNQ